MYDDGTRARTGLLALLISLGLFAVILGGAFAVGGKKGAAGRPFAAVPASVAGDPCPDSGWLPEAAAPVGAGSKRHTATPAGIDSYSAAECRRMLASLEGLRDRAWENHRHYASQLGTPGQATAEAQEMFAETAATHKRVQQLIEVWRGRLAAARD